MALPVGKVSKQAKACCGNAKLVITYWWFLTLGFGFMYAVAAIVAAAANNGKEIHDSKSLGFAGILAMLLVIGLSVGGTLVMRKYQTPLAVGFFIGVVVMMSFIMFILFILFTGEAYVAKMQREKGVRGTNVRSNGGAAAFSFFMFLLYAIFSAILVRNRTVIIKEGNTNDPTSGVPHEKNGVPISTSTFGRIDLDGGRISAPPVSV